MVGAVEGVGGVSLASVVLGVGVFSGGVSTVAVTGPSVVASSTGSDSMVYE